MTPSYHAHQLPLFPEKKCRKCPRILPDTEEYFYAKKLTSGRIVLNSVCKECWKKDVNRYPTKITLTCETCGKEFQRGKAHYEYQTKKHDRQHVYCSTDCCKSNAKEWPETIGEEYLQGATMNALAKKYGFTAKGVQNHLQEMGIQTGFTDLVRKRMSEITTERFSHPEEREKKRQQAIKMLENGTFKSSSKLEDKVALELSRRGIAFTRQRGIAVPGRRGFFACADFLLLDGTIIEVNGTYWHADPRRYPNGPINETQRKHVESDEKKRQILAEAGIPLIVLWEWDLTKDFMGTIDKALSSQ